MKFSLLDSNSFNLAIYASTYMSLHFSTSPSLEISEPIAQKAVQKKDSISLASHERMTVI